MKYFEVGYNVGDGIFSVNTIWANTGREELEAATETAERRAALHGYTVAYVKEITEAEAEVANRKGRPMYSIDDEAERAHDVSLSEEAEAESNAPALYVTKEAAAEWMELVSAEMDAERAESLLELIVDGIQAERPELVRGSMLDTTVLLVRQAYLLGFNQALNEVRGVQDVLLEEEEKLEPMRTAAE